MTPADVTALIRDDMQALHDVRVVAHVTSLLVNPPWPLLVWQPCYSLGETFEGFLVLNHSSGGTIAYCPHGFDPAVPWALISAPHGLPPSATVGDWYPRFLDVYFESKAVADLDIWRVKEQKPGQAPTWLSSELPWDEAWKRVKALRESAQDWRYVCEHSIIY